MTIEASGYSTGFFCFLTLGNTGDHNGQHTVAHMIANMKAKLNSDERQAYSA
jgi:hypothetical protein